MPGQVGWIRRTIGWLGKWESWRRILEVVVALSTLGAAVFAAVAASLAASAADDARTQIRSDIGSAEPYLAVVAVTLYNTQNPDRAPSGIALQMQNAGAHPASGVNVTLHIVNRTTGNISYKAFQNSSVDLVAGRDASISFGSLTGAALNDAYFIIRATYTDPILERFHAQKPICLAYETAPTQPEGVGTVACTQQAYDRAIAAQ